MPEERRIGLSNPGKDLHRIGLELLEAKKVVEDYLHAIQAARLRDWLRY